ncbi:MAG: Asp23/Gls24 family envelope stress response protein [Clostridiales bacterium]|nr:Asp23/Gls24 family envelope stress response protein [Clostridiales bacterium]
MIKLETSYGMIELTDEYFFTVISNALESCYGFSGLAEGSGVRHGIKKLLRGKKHKDSITVRRDGKALSADIHIDVAYETNISAVVKSIVNRIRYTLEEATGLEVKKINVFVDGMVRDQ